VEIFTHLLLEFFAFCKLVNVVWDAKVRVSSPTLVTASKGYFVTSSNPIKRVGLLPPKHHKKLAVRNRHNGDVVPTTCVLGQKSQ
jgi:hypothetical protein